MLKKTIGHFHTITKHKLLVFKFAIMAGIPWRGFMHDWSKYSPTEFFENSRYYIDSKSSPINNTKEIDGFSKAWLNHRGKNKHHIEYWYDESSRIATPVIPYNYAVEMLCDRIAAGIVYEGKEWKQDQPLRYFLESIDIKILNDKIYTFFLMILTQIRDDGINKTLKRKNLKEKYRSIVGE
ncbi:MAG: DUF5662 family protein [Clostridia bacterium]|nr:DUF5662 family protein [Clostridia bacterium]